MTRYKKDILSSRKFGKIKYYHPENDKRDLKIEEFVACKRIPY